MAGGKKVLCSSTPLSLLVAASLSIHFICGSFTCSIGVCALAASDGGDEMNLVAFQMSDSLISSSHSSQWLTFTSFIRLAYLLCCSLYSLCIGWLVNRWYFFAIWPILVVRLFLLVSLGNHHLLEYGLGLVVLMCLSIVSHKALFSSSSLCLNVTSSVIASGHGNSLKFDLSVFQNSGQSTFWKLSHGNGFVLATCICWSKKIHGVRGAGLKCNTYKM